MPTGESQSPTIYELQVLSISASKVSAQKASKAFKASSSSGLAMLRHLGVSGVPGMRYSLDSGVLVPVGHRPFAAHAGSAH